MSLRPLSATLLTRAAQALVPAALILALSACAPGATLTTANVAEVTSPTASSAGNAPTESAATESAATGSAAGATASSPSTSRRAAPGTGGPGSLTLILTSPKQAGGHVDTTVSCVPGRVYRAYAGGVVDGYTVRVAATAAGYVGPGSYPTTLSGSIVAPGGEAFGLAAVRTTAALSGTGGSVPFQATGSRGRTLSGSISWACS